MVAAKEGHTHTHSFFCVSPSQLAVYLQDARQFWIEVASVPMAMNVPLEHYFGTLLAGYLPACCPARNGCNGCSGRSGWSAHSGRSGRNG